MEQYYDYMIMLFYYLPLQQNDTLLTSFLLGQRKLQLHTVGPNFLEEKYMLLLHRPK